MLADDNIRDPCAGGVTFDEALARLSRLAQPLGCETVPLEQAHNRVLWAPVFAMIDSPRQDVAAMDGFAVASFEGRSFRIAGTTYAGGIAPQPLGARETVRAMTGAPVPIGAFRVIPFELADVIGDRVKLPPAGQAKPHVRRRGSDFLCGKEVLPAGTLLGARSLLVARAADAGDVTVWRHPAVRIVTCGDELVAPGTAHRDLKRMPDSLSISLTCLARQWSARMLGPARVGDTSDALRAALSDESSGCDVTVLVGGASKGDRDLSRAVALELGYEMVFAGVAMKPGKPVWCARRDSRFMLGLPGNPTAAFTTARLFLAPLLSALAGRGFETALQWQDRMLLGDGGTGGDREAFLCAVDRDDGVAVLERQTASAQLMLAQADMIVRFPPDHRIAAGATLPCLRF